VPQPGSTIFRTTPGSGITMANFRFETVDGAANAKGLCSLALDGAGNPRIAFAGPRGEIKLAQRNDGRWSVEDVIAGGAISISEENRVWLQLDSAGNPQIAYVAQISSRLVHGVKGKTEWTFQNIPSSTLAPIHISFVIHPGPFTTELRDTPHFLFRDGSQNGLGYTRLINGEFETVKISPEATESGMFTSAVVDRNSEEINIAYVANLADPAHQMMHFIRVMDPTAQVLSIDKGTLSVAPQLGKGRYIRLTSIAGETGRNCIACYDATDRTLKAFVQESGVVSHEKIVQNVGRNRGLYRVAFADANKMKLASRDRFLNWTIETVDATGGAMPSLAYDKANNCHIGYVAGTTLKYATRNEAA
jgi:hypothetical protein